MVASWLELRGHLRSNRRSNTPKSQNQGDHVERQRYLQPAPRRDFNLPGCIASLDSTFRARKFVGSSDSRNLHRPGVPFRRLLYVKWGNMSARVVAFASSHGIQAAKVVNFLDEAPCDETLTAMVRGLQYQFSASDQAHLAQDYLRRDSTAQNGKQKARSIPASS
jgi:hypothetical protein